MTVFIASLFLPYTIDFKSTGQSSARRRRSSPSYSAVDNSGLGPIDGRQTDPRRKLRVRSSSLALTPGATTEDEKIFKAYASQSAGEIPTADDPAGPGPNEPRAVPWGQSRKFNQPRSKATLHPEPSILSRPSSCQESRDSFLVGAPGQIASSQPGSPRATACDDDWAVKAAEQGHGGLQNAIHAAEEAGVLQNKLWVGTLGMPTDSLHALTREAIQGTLREEYESLAVFVSDSEFEGHYAHFCRSVLWPALHYQMQESPRHIEYDDYSWKQYLKVNEAFADAIANSWRPGDCIWIHDYHLLTLPGLLRKRLPHAEIGFFLHTAFPSSEIFRCLKSREALLDGLLGADLIGFQTDEYCHHFQHSCSRLLRLEVSVDGVQLKHNGRFVQVRCCPLGIDYESLNILRQSAEVKVWISSITQRYSGKHMIVARDRLDVPGGVKQKLHAYELFLERHPEWRDNVVLVQITSSVSDIPELETQISKIAMKINSLYSTITHQPLVLLQQDISYSQFLALLSVAEIFMATNLREGMNLTSHDFIHCQDGELAPQRYGSLILSEFTGSASIFHGHELIVNPWDYKQCADAIKKALEMSPEQKQCNWKFLLERKSPHTALAWYSFLQTALTDAHSMQQARDAQAVCPLRIEDLRENYNSSETRLIFVEDGATFITPTNSDPSKPSQEAVEILEILADDPKNIVYLTSNRSPEQLDSMASVLPENIGMIAENGCFIKLLRAPFWISLVDVKRTQNWRAGIRKVIEYFAERTEGSTIEERRCTLTFHCSDAVDPDIAARQASELADQINGSRGSEPIRVVRDIGAVSIESQHASKAEAASFVLQKFPENHFPNFVFVAGGARGDEALFRWANRLTVVPSAELPNLAVTTLTAGTHATEARARLPDGVSMVAVLRSLVPGEST
ncbi:alpha-trehalose phosphate synthase subunit [Penicillium argentinense]|uniref:Alpha-trehalose phosphate synthase subunit n=1 Tax=Penicillium argentinense TaxID=1131581 RepID=A0A9W9FN51_9EURO|nr:alpha-trehalose phosphate synthase subunit [Penicillium argentinense]KAJ5103270.1 alpha-trehalose phosphate synthase subunit [Penicillium argentinense]